jgi:hypothetical protein
MPTERLNPDEQKVLDLVIADLNTKEYVGRKLEAFNQQYMGQINNQREHPLGIAKLLSGENGEVMYLEDVCKDLGPTSGPPRFSLKKIPHGYVVELGASSMSPGDLFKAGEETHVVVVNEGTGYSIGQYLFMSLKRERLSDILQH